MIGLKIEIGLNACVHQKVLSTNILQLPKVFNVLLKENFISHHIRAPMPRCAYSWIPWVVDGYKGFPAVARLMLVFQKRENPAASIQLSLETPKLKSISVVKDFSELIPVWHIVPILQPISHLCCWIKTLTGFSFETFFFVVLDFSNKILFCCYIIVLLSKLISAME